MDFDPLSLQRVTLSGAALHATARLLAQDPMALAQVKVSEELELIRNQFSRFGAEAFAPLAEKIHRHDLIVPEELLQPLRDMGVFGLSIPERYGGSAAGNAEDNLTMIVVTEALSQASLAAAGSLITRPEILSRALLTGGTETQKQHWLPRLAQGDPLCAIAITEPDYGSDVASLSLRGTPTEGGWLLNGAKTWCTFAGKAGVLMVVTRTNPDKSLGHRGLSLLLAEKPSYDGHDFDYRQEGGGRLAGRAIPTIGYRGMHSFDLSFENFFVADANVIGEEGGAGPGLLLHHDGHDRRAHADRGTRQRPHARCLARGPSLCRGAQGVRRCADRLSADRGQACEDGGALSGQPLPDLLRRQTGQRGRRPNGG